MGCLYEKDKAVILDIGKLEENHCEMSNLLFQCGLEIAINRKLLGERLKHFLLYFILPLLPAVK